MSVYMTVAEIMDRWCKRDAQQFRQYWLPQFKGVRKIGRSYLIPTSEVVRVENEHRAAPGVPSVAEHFPQLRDGVQGESHAG